MRASAGSIAKIGNNRWRIRITAGFDPQTGKPRRISKTIRGSKRDAECIKAKLLSAEHPELNQKIKVCNVVLEYLEQKKGSIREPTWQEYERMAKYILNSSFSNLTISRLETQEKVVRDWLYGFTAPYTRKSLYKLLRQVLNYAKKQHYITVSVLDYIPEPKVERREIQTISSQEIQSYLDAIRETDIEAGILLMLFLGLRRSEALALKWKQLDLDSEEPLLRVESSVREIKGGGVIFSEPKTVKSKRTIYIPDPCVERLRRIWNLKRGNTWVSEFNGEVMRPDLFSKLWRRYINKAGLKPISIKNLRHSCGTMLVRELGVEVSDVAELLGHTTIRTTEQFYLQSSKESKKRTAKAWNLLEF